MSAAHIIYAKASVLGYITRAQITCSFKRTAFRNGTLRFFSLHTPSCTVSATSNQPTSQISSLLRWAQNARLTDAAHEIWKEIIQPGDVVVDATCGNGHDTLFLARAVGPTGTVYAFDIQPLAMQSTETMIKENISNAERPRIEYRNTCHSKLQEEVGSHKASIICFNLGYLPSGDKSITTAPETTLLALEAALEVLKPGGILSVLCYYMHPGGQEELEAVESLLSGLPPAFWMSTHIKLLNRKGAPILITVYKRPQKEENPVGGWYTKDFPVR